MTLEQFHQWLAGILQQYPDLKTKEILIECPETGCTWSIDGIGFQDSKVILTINELKSTVAPETEFYIL